MLSRQSSSKLFKSTEEIVRKAPKPQAGESKCCKDITFLHGDTHRQESPPLVRPRFSGQLLPIHKRS
jgi:hypothetical protein